MENLAFSFGVRTSAQKNTRLSSNIPTRGPPCPMSYIWRLRRRVGVIGGVLFAYNGTGRQPPPHYFWENPSVPPACEESKGVSCGPVARGDKRAAKSFCVDM